MKLNKILIVEDSELLHKMYNLILFRFKTQGTQIIHAMNGQEGLMELYSNPDTNLILLDINMPVMNGVQFLKTIRREGAFTHIPVVIVSTEGKEEDTLFGLSLGAKAYITKPFQGPHLLKLIDKVLTNGA